MAIQVQLTQNPPNGPIYPHPAGIALCNSCPAHCNPPGRPPLPGRYTGISIVLFQQITGQPSVLYYATDIFQRVGFSSAQDASNVSVILVTSTRGLRPTPRGESRRRAQHRSREELF